MRYAFAVSVGIHLAVLGGAWLMLNWPEPPQEAGVESISVDIVMIEDFTSSAPSTVETSATEALVAAGAEPVEAVEAEPTETEPMETIGPMAEPITAAPARPLAVAPIEIEEAASLPVLTATPTTALPVEDILPATPEAIATKIVAKATQTVEAATAEIPIETVAPLEPKPATTQSPAEPLQPVEEQEVVVAPTPKVRTVAQKKEPTYPEAEPVRERKPVTDTKRAKADAPRKKLAQPAGSGGNSNASSVASAASGGKAGGDAAGNAAVSKYPGLVQQKLRRALRVPRGANGAQGEVQVQFVVSASGAASGISIVRSSGHAIFDEAAVATVKRAAPFPPIPPAAGKSSWTFVMPLLFQR
jgi:protein TonB